MFELGVKKPRFGEDERWSEGLALGIHQSIHCLFITCCLTDLDPCKSLNRGFGTSYMRKGLKEENFKTLSPLKEELFRSSGIFLDPKATQGMFPLSYTSV